METNRCADAFVQKGCSQINGWIYLFIYYVLFFLYKKPPPPNVLFFIEFDNYETFFVRALTLGMLNAKFVAFSILNTKNHVSSSVLNVKKI